MNGNVNDSLGTDPGFDRLVDGELDEHERGELLAGLDNEPSGWRRCALAFLEAQCWKEAFRSPRQADASPPLAGPQSAKADAAPARVEIASPAMRWAGRLGTVAAMAASFLLALWLGSLAQRTWTGPRGPLGLGGMGDVAKTNGGRPAATPLLAESEANPAASPWRWVTVSAPGNGAQEGVSFQVPAVERDGIDEQWLQSMPPAIPDDVLQALSRTGHQVQQRRQLVPVRLGDGRQLIVPVDQVELHYVGNGTY